MDGSDHPTIPRQFARSTKINHGRADRQPGTGDGAWLHEVNMWMWNSGRGMPRPRRLELFPKLSELEPLIQQSRERSNMLLGNATEKINK